jgi:hypothetical protein
VTNIVLRYPGSENAPGLETTALGVRVEWKPENGQAGYWVYRSKTAQLLGDRITSKPIVGGVYFDYTAEPGVRYRYTVVRDGQEPGKIAAAVDSNYWMEEVDGEGEKHAIVMKIGQDTMLFGEDLIEIDPGRGTSPVIREGRTFVPIRAIIEAMGGTVDWDEAERKVTLTAGGHVVEMWIDRTEFTIDEQLTRTADVPPAIVNGRTLLPVRFVTEGVGCRVAWIGSAQQIVIVWRA